MAGLCWASDWTRGAEADRLYAYTTQTRTADFPDQLREVLEAFKTSTDETVFDLIGNLLAKTVTVCPLEFRAAVEETMLDADSLVGVALRDVYDLTAAQDLTRCLRSLVEAVIEIAVTDTHLREKELRNALTSKLEPIINMFELDEGVVFAPARGDVRAAAVRKFFPKFEEVFGTGVSEGGQFRSFYSDLKAQFTHHLSIASVQLALALNIGHIKGTAGLPGTLKCWVKADSAEHDGKSKRRRTKLTRVICDFDLFPPCRNSNTILSLVVAVCDVRANGAVLLRVWCWRGRHRVWALLSRFGTLLLAAYALC